MKLLKFASGLLLALFFIFQFSHCHHHEDPNPCQALKPITADFKIQEVVGDSLVETDTVVTWATVQFAIKETETQKYDSVVWKIGDDTRTFNKKSFKLAFYDLYDPAAIRNVTVEVRCIVYGKPDKNCFPTDNGIDTLTKSFYIIDIAKAPILGKYVGSYDSSPTKKDTIEMVWRPLFDNTGVYYDMTYAGSIEHVNLLKGCSVISSDDWRSSPTRNGARACKYDGKTGVFPTEYCKNMRAWVFLKDRNTIEADFDYDTDPFISNSPRIKDRFIGKRL